MNCSKCDLYFSSPGCLSIHEKSCRLSKSLINHLKNDYINGLSIRKLNLKYGCSKSLISNLILDIVRTKSESSKLAHSLYADKFKHSEESKQKLREKRIKWMKENPEKTAWRTSNLSYPEKVFLNKIKYIEYDKKYKIEREKSVFPFYIDFAFIEQKLAIEIDGSQHLLPDRVLSDERKDTFLKENGWIIVRFTASEVIKNVDLVISKLDSLLNATIE